MNSIEHNKPIRYSIGKDKYDNIPQQLTAEDFNEFETAILGRKSTEKGKTFFCAGFRNGSHKDINQYPVDKTYRQKELVEAKRFHALDFDGFSSPETFNKCFELFKDYRGFGYTTWSHLPEKPRARAVFELSREVTRSEGILLGQAFQKWIESLLGVGEVLFDDSVYRAEQPIYGPPDNADIYRFRGKQPIDVDTFLVDYTPVNQENINQHVDAFQPSTNPSYVKLTSVSLIEVLAKLDNTDEPIWTEVANALSRVYGEVGRKYFIDFSEGVFSGVKYHKFDLVDVNERYDRAIRELSIIKTGIGLKRLWERAGINPFHLEFEPEPLTDNEKASQEAFLTSLPDYEKYQEIQITDYAFAKPIQSGPLIFPVVNKNNKPTQVSENLKALLNHCNITVRYNQIKKNTEILIPTMQCVVDERENTSLTILIDEAVKAGLSPTRIDEMASAIASQNPYCPVQTYLESVPWDGISRITDFCNQIKTPNVLMANFLIRKWLLQAVAAVYERNGLSGAGVLVFTGAQAAGKTRLYRDLTSGLSEVFLEGAILNPNDKDSVFTACSHWIVELGELDATFKKADIAQLKAFLTKSVDKLRKPYAKKDSTFLRRTVFAGTVNDFQFLQDSTGNRRYWPIETTSVIRDTAINYQQLWAEIKTIYDSGESWHLSKAELIRLNQHTEQFLVTEPVVEMLLKKYDFAGCTKWQEKLMVDICSDIYLDRPTRGDMQKLAAAIKKYNGEKKPRQSNGKKYHWVPA